MFKGRVFSKNRIYFRHLKLEIALSIQASKFSVIPMVGYSVGYCVSLSKIVVHTYDFTPSCLDIAQFPLQCQDAFTP